MIEQEHIKAQVSLYTFKKEMVNLGIKQSGGIQCPIKGEEC